jgi:hypothetical protein
MKFCRFLFCTGRTGAQASHRLESFSLVREGETDASPPDNKEPKMHRRFLTPLQHSTTTTLFNTLQHSSTLNNTLQHSSTQQHTTTHTTTQQHTTTHNNTQQHTTTHNNAQQHTATHNNTQQEQHLLTTLQFGTHNCKIVH